MKKLVALLAAVTFVSGCSTLTPARYSMSADNNMALSQFEGVKVEMASMTPPTNFDANCRMVGPIKAADGKSIPQFVQGAFNDEFKVAGIYSEDGIKLRGNLTDVAFSSSAGVTNGWWKLSIDLTSSTGESLQKSSQTEFESGFGGLVACNNTAQALNGAVQDLINAVVTDPQFVDLVK